MPSTDKHFTTMKIKMHGHHKQIYFHKVLNINTHSNLETHSTLKINETKGQCFWGRDEFRENRKAADGVTQGD